MAESEQERTPFMSLMKWDEHLAEIRKSEQWRTLILELKSPAGADDQGYGELRTVVLAYIKRGMAIGSNHNNSSRVRQHLAQGAVLSSTWYVFTYNSITKLH
jgi:hypothetical protein